MRAYWIAVWLLATGCDRVFGLAPTRLSDAGECVGPDEDSDCVPDHLDNCPGLANADQADNDGDGVGDVCDPDDNSQQTRLSFSPFSGADLGSWQAGTATWVIDTVHGQIQHVTANDTSLFGQTVPNDVTDLTVEATFIYHSHAAASPPNRMGVWIDTPLGVENGQACWIDPANKSAEIDESVGTGSVNRTALNIAPLADGARYTVQLRRVRDAMSPVAYCSIFLDATRSPLPPDAGHTGWLTGGYIAISADGVVADLQDVVIYGPSL